MGDRARVAGSSRGPLGSFGQGRSSRADLLRGSCSGESLVGELVHSAVPLSPCKGQLASFGEIGR
jgi:hypothetical protein